MKIRQNFEKINPFKNIDNIVTLTIITKIMYTKSDKFTYVE